MIVCAALVQLAASARVGEVMIAVAEPPIQQMAAPYLSLGALLLKVGPNLDLEPFL